LAHGKLAIRNTSSLKTNLSIKIIFVSENKSLSEVCNVGLANARGEFICWFSDDDDWIEGKLLNLFNGIASNSGYDVYIGQSLIQKRVRPRIGIQESESVFHYLYGRKVLLNHSNFLGLMNSAVRNQKSNPQFRKGLSVYEDVLWLSDLKNSKKKFFQIQEVFSRFKPVYERSNQRQDIKAIEFLYDEISHENPSIALSFLIYHASRASIASGSLENYLKISKHWFFGKNLIKYFHVFAFQYTLTVSIKLLKILRISPM
jgi:glycosyltransferase involved in cell wall biosynthesis